MNRLGMMVDLSHPSKGANMEAMRLSQAPVIASHSAVRALADVSRNMDDEQLLALKKNGGVIQVWGSLPISRRIRKNVSVLWRSCVTSSGFRSRQVVAEVGGVEGRG